MKKRKIHSKEFKLEALRQWEQGGQSDRGATWSAQTYRQALNREGMIASMSRKGDCWDNAVRISFFGQLKNEWTYGQDYPDQDQARAALYEYIELFYNDQRLHQTLGYIPQSVDLRFPLPRE